MPRKELNSDEFPIEQKPPVDPANYDGDVIVADKPLNKDFADALAFNEEPVTIRLEPSAEKNAASAFPVWVNGVGAEVFQNGRWEVIGYLPIGRIITVKRKVVEVIARAKVDTVDTGDSSLETINRFRGTGRVGRFTSAAHSYSIIEDANPKGAAWLTELRRQNF